MKKVKWFCLMLLMLLGFQSGQAQVYKFLTTSFSVMEKDDKGNWGKWSDLQEASIVIKLDTNKNRIIIYSQEIQLYDIVNYEQKEENENTIVNPFSCTDPDGVPFTITIITRKNQGNRKQLYLNQKNVVVVYNIVTDVDKNHK